MYTRQQWDTATSAYTMMYGSEDTPTELNTEVRHRQILCGYVRLMYEAELNEEQREYLEASEHMMMIDIQKSDYKSFIAAMNQKYQSELPKEDTLDYWMFWLIQPGCAINGYKNDNPNLAKVVREVVPYEPISFKVSPKVIAAAKDIKERRAWNELPILGDMVADQTGSLILAEHFKEDFHVVGCWGLRSILGE